MAPPIIPDELVAGAGGLLEQWVIDDDCFVGGGGCEGLFARGFHSCGLVVIGEEVRSEAEKDGLRWESKYVMCVGMRERRRKTLRIGLHIWMLTIEKLVY
jgi:hypothetical protein